MTVPLPAQGDTDWYDWAQQVDTQTRSVPDLVSRTDADARYRRDADKGVSLYPLPGRLFNVKAQNAEPYSQDSVTTDNGVQYAVWVSAPSMNPVIGKRTVPHGDWVTFDLSTVASNPLSTPTFGDLHNNYVIGVDSAGYIHVSGNHHDNPLRYVRSTTPGDITSWTAPGMIGINEDSVTYPQFVRMTNGEMLFVYRNGVSGGGDVFINAYNVTSKTWSRRSNPIVGSTSSPTQSPYTNHVAVGADGSMHLFFMWRITDDVAQTHDLHHTKSLDRGQTWQTANGTAVTLPIVPTTTVTLLKSGNNQMINQGGADVDSLGRPHGIFWMFLDSGATTTELHHWWYDSDGWHDYIEDSFGENYYVATLNLARPMVFCYGGRTFIVYSREYDGHRRRWLVKDITPPLTGGARLPDTCVLEADLGLFEPAMDTRAIRERGEFNMLVTPIQPVITGVDPNYTSQWGAILSLDLNKVEVASSSLTPASKQDDRRWVPAADFVSTSGSPALNAAVSTPGWQFVDAATPVVTASWMLPDAWRKYNVEMWWVNNGTDVTSTVVFNARYATRIAGKSASAGEVNLGNVTLTPGAQSNIVITTIATGMSAMPENLVKFNVRRLGTDAADINTGTMSFLGVMLRRTV